MAARKRPEERPSRLTIEYYGPGEDELITRLRVSAVQRKEPVRDWVLRAIRHELERLDRQERAQPERQVRELPRVADVQAEYDPNPTTE